MKASKNESIEDVKDVILIGKNCRVCYDIGNGYSEKEINDETEKALKIVDEIDNELNEYRKIKGMIEENIKGDIDETDLVEMIKGEYYYNIGKKE